MINRLWIIAFIQQEKSRHLTYSELLEQMQLSRHGLLNNLDYLVSRGYLMTKNGVYWLNPEYEADWKWVNSNTVGYLGYSISKRGRKAFNQLRKKMPGFYKYNEEIKRFADEARTRRSLDL
jgi:hypothetical protein